MDTLSNKTYILERKAQQLELCPQSQEKLFVSVFGTNRTLEVETLLVTFGAGRRDG